MLFNIFIIYLFIYFPLQILFPFWYTLPLFLRPALVSKRISLPPTTHTTRTLNSLRPPVSWWLGVSSLIEPRPSSPLLYMFWGASYQWVYVAWLVVQCLAVQRYAYFQIIRSMPKGENVKAIRENKKYWYLIIFEERWNIITFILNIKRMITPYVPTNLKPWIKPNQLLKFS